MVANEAINIRLKNIEDRLKEVVDTLKTGYVSVDKLELRLAPLESSRRLNLWLLGIVVVETMGLMFYLIRIIITGGQSR